jgi:hypothetical protein
MPFNWGLLSNESLANQPEQVRQGLQEQATKQLLMNTFLGGGIMSGLRAAQAVPEQYQTAVEQRALDRAAAQARSQATRPVGLGLDVQGQQAQMLADQEAGMGSTAPTVAALQSNPNIPRQLDVAEYARQIPSIIAQAGPRAKLGNLEKILETQLKVAPTWRDGMQIDQLSGRALQFKPNVTAQGTVQLLGVTPTGEYTAQELPISGVREARASVTLPPLNPGEQYMYDANGKVAGVMNAAGAVRALAERQAVETAVREANIPRAGFTQSGAPTFNFVTPPGLQALQPQATPSGGVAAPAQPQATGGTAFGPTTAQAAVNAAYEPILKDAYAGFKLASGRSGTLQSIRNALSNPNFDTNAFTPAKTALTSFLSASGVTGNNANQFLTNASAFRQGLNTIASQSVSELPGAISNFELQFAQSRFGTLTDPKQANLYAIDLMEASDKRKRDFYNFVQKNPRPDVIEAWQNSPQGSKGIFEDPKLRKYLPQRPVATGANKGKTAYNLPSGEWVVFE